VLVRSNLFYSIYSTLGSGGKAEAISDNLISKASQTIHIRADYLRRGLPRVVGCGGDVVEKCVDLRGSHVLASLSNLGHLFVGE